MLKRFCSIIARIPDPGFAFGKWVSTERACARSANAEQGLHRAEAAVLDGIRVAEVERGPDRAVLLDMQDNGRGIPPANRDKIFTPFFTTNRDNGGTGLGLRIVQTMIESHSGKIELGETQSGTLFTLQLPLA